MTIDLSGDLVGYYSSHLIILMQNVSGFNIFSTQYQQFSAMHYFNGVDFLLISECHVIWFQYNWTSFG